MILNKRKFIYLLYFSVIALLVTGCMKNTEKLDHVHIGYMRIGFEDKIFTRINDKKEYWITFPKKIKLCISRDAAYQGLSKTYKISALGYLRENLKEGVGQMNAYSNEFVFKRIISGGPKNCFR